MTWQLDKAHSHIQFTVRHLMISKVRGFFDEFDVSIDYDEENPINSVIEATIYTDSASTRDPQRDAHLKTNDFFDVENFPTATFRSTRIERTGADKGRMYGDLTIRNITKPVVVDVEYLGAGQTPWGTTNAGFTGTTTIDRRDWGLVWNQGLDTGGVLAGWNVQLDIEMQITKVAEPEAAAEAA